MRVTRRYYPYVFSNKVDGSADQLGSATIPGAAGLTLLWSYTVPAGFIAVLRGVAVSYTGVSAVAPADIRLSIRITRPGGIQADVLDWWNRFSVSEGEAIPFEVPMPTGTILEAYAANRNAAARVVRMSAMIDLISV